MTDHSHIERRGPGYKAAQVHDSKTKENTRADHVLDTKAYLTSLGTEIRPPNPKPVATKPEKPQPSKPKLP